MPFTGTKMMMHFFHFASVICQACNIIWLSTNHEINRWTRNKNNSKQRKQRRLFTSCLKLFPPSIWLTFGSFSVPSILKGTTTSVLQITWNALLSFKLFCKRSQEVYLGATSSVVKPHIPVCKHSITLLLWFFVVFIVFLIGPVRSHYSLPSSWSYLMVVNST